MKIARLHTRRLVVAEHPDAGRQGGVHRALAGADEVAQVGRRPLRQPQGQGARAAVVGLFAAGWLTVLGTTFLINHFDLFGLRQVWLSSRGVPYTPLRFATPWPYRVVRHP